MPPTPREGDVFEMPPSDDQSRVKLACDDFNRRMDEIAARELRDKVAIAVLPGLIASHQGIDYDAICNMALCVGYSYIRVLQRYDNPEPEAAQRTPSEDPPF